MMYQFSGNKSDDENVSLDGQIVSMNDTFWYLRSMLQSDGVIDENVNHQIRAGWVKWRQTFNILYDKKV
jgi:DNA-directed RNA polymerase delta subunit